MARRLRLPSLVNPNEKQAPPSQSPPDDEKVDEAGDESFPASDPPSFTPSHPGEPAGHEPKKD